MNEDRNAALDGCVAGREVTRTPDFSLGRSWIHECVEAHEECRHPLESQLPPRIIDVGQADGSKMPRLVLCDGCVGDFATLSHCWGDSKPMVTNSKTLEAHMKGIPYANLPKTFQHAVIATRELGLKYLWIDSLCIIQDSQEDWERQCSKMPEIYRNSIVTIAGPGASHCNAGFLQNRCAPLQADLKVSNGEIDETITLSHYGVRSPFYPDPEKDSPLAKRAWVLQERLLSRRVLYFGSEFMYFECCTNVRHESLHFPSVDDYKFHREVAKMAFTTSEQDSSFWLQYWTQIVKTYSNAALTFPSDRLPAISGIAKAIQQKLQDTYLAGLWLTDMPRGLTWYTESFRNYDRLAQSSNDSVLPYMAPSWSWASVNGGVDYRVPNYSSHQFVSESIEIVGHDIEVRGLDPLGEVSRGALILRGRLQSFIILNGSQLWAGGSSRDLHVCSSQSRDLLAYFCPVSPKRFQPQQTSADTSLEDAWSERPITLLYLGQFKRGQEWHDSILLAIEAIPGTEDQYRRVGLVISTSEESPDIRGHFQNSAMELVRLI
jgi:hypothetical protein